MSEPPAKPAPEPADGPPPKPQLKRIEGELPSGLTYLSNPSDSAPKIDESKRARVDELWKAALEEGARPSSTIGSLGTVSLHPDSPTLDWQRKLPRAQIGASTSATVGGAKVVVDDPTGKVQVHHGDEGDPLAGNTLDALAGRTMDAPPKPVPPPGTVTDGEPDETTRTTADLSGTPYTQSGPQAPNISIQPTAADSASDTDLSSTAPTLPGRPVNAPHPGTRMVPPGTSRIQGPRPEEFRIRAKLASGGMGEVFVATQLGLNREVALKRPKPGHGDREARLAAFVREGTVTGDLEHPSIVPIYQNGVDADGLPFYAMKLVHGIEWRFLLHPELAKERKDPDFIQNVANKGAAMDLHAHLDVLLKVCDAVAFAHSRYILHRDLKPENVIVGEYGEVQVMDWGLAIDYRDQTPDSAKALSRSNIRGPAGTPAYMAPEMALGDVRRIGPATDVYLLGAILYEILTGRPPHAASKLDRVLYQAAVNEYTPVRHSNLNVPPGLEAIINKALATVPGDRYTTVQEFQAALREHLTHEQSQKISTKAEEDLNALTAAAQAEATREADLPAAQREAEHSARYVQFAAIVAAFRQALELWPLNLPARAGLIRSLTVFVNAALDGGDLGLARAQIEQLRTAIDHSEAKQREALEQLTRRWTELDAARQARQRNFKLAMAAVAALAFIVIVGGIWSYINIRAEKDRAEQNFTEAEKQRKAADEQRQKAEANFAEAETQRSRAEKARLDADQQRQVAETNAELARKNEATAVAEKTEADRQRAEADRQRQVAETQKAEAEKQRAIADDQRKVAEAKTVEANDQRKLAETNLAEAERQRKAAVLNLGAVDIQRARTLIAVSRDYPQAAVYLLRAVENTQSVDPTKALRELDYVLLTSPRLKTSGFFRGHARRLHLAGEPGTPVAVLCDDGSVHWQPLVNDLEANRFQALQYSSPARDFAVFAGSWVVLTADGKLQRLVGVATESGADTAEISVQPLEIAALTDLKWTCLAADPEGKRLALGAADGRLVVLTAPADKNSPPTVLVNLPAHRGAVSGLAFRGDSRSARGRRGDTAEPASGPADRETRPDELVTCGADGRLCLWNLEKKSLALERLAHLGFASTLALNTRGTLAATAGPEGTIKVWNLADLSERLTLQGHAREVGSLAFHPFAPVLASQSFDGTVRLWNVASEQIETPILATLHVENSGSALQVLFADRGNLLTCLNTRGVLILDLKSRIDCTPRAWPNFGANPLELLQADGDQLLYREGSRLGAIAYTEDKPHITDVPDLCGAFVPGGGLPITTNGDQPTPICLTKAGLIGPAGKLELLAPKEAGKITGWTRQGAWVLLNRGGRFFLADTAQKDWKFREIHGDAESAGTALGTDGRWFSWTAENQMTFSPPPPADPAAETSATHLTFPFRQKILQAVWLPDHSGVVLRTGTATLPIVRLDGSETAAIGGHLAPVRAIAIDDTGRFLASADATGQIRLTDLTDRTGAPLGPLLPAPPDDLRFDRDSHYLSCLAGGRIFRYRLPQADPAFDLDTLKNQVAQDLGFSADRIQPNDDHNILTPEAGNGMEWEHEPAPAPQNPAEPQP